MERLRHRSADAGCPTGDDDCPWVLSHVHGARSIVDAALKSMAQIAKLAKQYSTDCEALAKALAAHAEKNKAVIAAFKKLSADETKQRDIAQRHGGQILAIGQETVKALQANCAEHPAVRQLFQSLNQ